MSGLAGQSGRAAALKRQRLKDRSSEPEELTVLLVDARPWTREALARGLETACKVLRLGGPSDLAQADAQGGAAVILLNVTGMRLADSRISDSIATARHHLPSLPVVALSESADAEDILGAIEQGLSGYIPISLELRLVIEALRFVAAGGTFVPAEPLLANLEDAAPPRLRPEASVGEAAASTLANDAASVTSILETLTPREVAVLDCVRRGKSNKQIARELDMSEATVKVHVSHIMRKMGAVNRTQVALFAEVLVKK